MLLKSYLMVGEPQVDNEFVNPVDQKAFVHALSYKRKVKEGK